MDAANITPQENEEVAGIRPQVHVLRGPVGSGKTKDILKVCGEQQHEKGGQIAGFSPRHDLNDDIAERWETETSLSAVTLMGRTAKKDTDPSYCYHVPQVEMVQDLNLPVKASCCGSKKSEPEDRCVDYFRCGYNARLIEAKEADLVLMPHASMVHQQKELPGIPHITFIDEDFIDGLIFELPKKGSSFRFEVEDLVIERNEPKLWYSLPWNFNHFRVELFYILQEQIKAGEMGGIRRKYFATGAIVAGVEDFWISPSECGEALRSEYEASPPIADLKPNLRGIATFKKRNAKLLTRRARHMFMVQVWSALAEMLNSDIEISGRVFLYEDRASGRVCIGVRGLKHIVKQWRAPHIFVASATMPSLEIINHAFPNCDIIPDDDSYEVAMTTNTQIIQVINGPVAKHRTKKESNRMALRRYAVKCALEYSLPSTLIGVQKDVEEKFKEMQPALPENFSVRHFNAVAGINDYENVDLMISMGRSAPSPVDVENQIAAITSRDPERLPEQEWFMKAKAKIQLRDGSEVEVDCYMHPDPVVEAWRRHKHISPVIQMIGRARPYNRTKENPLVIYVLLNEPLGIPVDQVLDWNKDELEPMALVDPMGCDGWVALSPEVMCALWPTVFKSRRTAERELQELRGSGKRAKDILAILAIGRWQRFTFQKPGARQKSREGYYDKGRFENAEALRSGLEKVTGPGLQLREG